MPRRGRHLAVLALLGFLAAGSLAVDRAGADRLGHLRSKIQATQGRLAQKHGHARLLTTEMAGYTQRIGRLQGSITGLERRQVRLQTDLDAKRSELFSIQSTLRTARGRLARLR